MAQERTDLSGRELTNVDGRDDVAEAPKREISLAEIDQNRSDDPEKIKQQIEETRAEMGETIDAIQERLSFANISSQVSEQVNHAVQTAKGAVYDATLGKAVNVMKNIANEISDSSVAHTVKRNPIPFILIGAGAGMLAYQAYNGKGNGRSRGSIDQGRRLSDGLDTAESKLHKVSDSVTDTLGGVRDSVSAAAGTAYDKVSSALDTTYQKAGELGSSARDQYEHYLEENPLAVGAVALALGAAVGLAIPSTRYEGKLMGQARQDLLDKAQNTASNLMHETKRSVGEAGQKFADNTSTITEH